MHFHFLGTGAGVPSKKRNVSSYVLDLSQERGSIWMFDCGEATQHQILHTPIKPAKIEKIFITHLHGDHIFGLPGLLGSRSFQGGRTPVDVYGPTGIKSFIDTALSISQTRLAYPLHIKEIDEGTIFEDDQFTIETKKLDHGIPSFAYRVIEQDKVGELMPDKLKEAGIPPGPIYRKIKENPEVTLEDGTVVFRKDYVGPPKKGKVMTVFGDTRYHEEFISFARDSDVLIYESTFGPEDQQLAYDYFHSTALQGAELAKKANVKKLILTHISSRYQDPDIESILAKTKDIFPNTVIAYDFMQVGI